MNFWFDERFNTKKYRILNPDKFDTLRFQRRVRKCRLIVCHRHLKCKNYSFRHVKSVIRNECHNRLTFFHPSHRIQVRKNYVFASSLLPSTINYWPAVIPFPLGFDHQTINNRALALFCLLICSIFDIWMLKLWQEPNQYNETFTYRHIFIFFI